MLYQWKISSRKKRQNYYRKRYFKNNETAQILKNEDNIVETYHEIEFGAVPKISDYRSLPEKLADSRKPQDKNNINFNK